MTMTMKPYTVVLLRPEYLTEESGEEYGEEYGLDTYVASVQAGGLSEAITTAQNEVFAADKREDLEPAKPEDYKMCLIFEGHQKVLMWGWQV